MRFQSGVLVLLLALLGTAAGQTSSANYTYTVLQSGSCGTDWVINTTTECAAAAASLGFLNTNAQFDQQYGVSYDPPGCYFENGNLKVNTNNRNTGACSSGDRCVCRKPLRLYGGVRNNGWYSTSVIWIPCALDSCYHASDGDCDDGGPGSEYQSCGSDSVGTDFTDCGFRCNMLCDAATSGISCLYTNDNVCDDGGPGSMHSRCPYGSDCRDCGIRYTSSSQPSPPPQISPPPSPQPPPGYVAPPPPPLPSAPPSNPPEIVTFAPPNTPAPIAPELAITAFEREATESLVFTLIKTADSAPAAEVNVEVQFAGLWNPLVHNLPDAWELWCARANDAFLTSLGHVSPPAPTLHL